MVKMNKEEIIEYFITLLGDNRVLGKFISIEEIRKILNENIKEVTCNPEPNNISSRWRRNKNTLNIDFNKFNNEIDFQVDVVHEMLHILTYSRTINKNTTLEKGGIELNFETNEKETFKQGWSYTTDNKLKIWGKSLNEGITQLLTEEILGIDTEIYQGYKLEKDIARLLFAIVGKENVIEKYIEKIQINKNDKYDMPIYYFFENYIKNDYKHHIKVLEELKDIYNDCERLTIIKYNMNNETTVNKEDEKNYNEIKSKLALKIKKLIITSLENSRGNFNKKNDIINSAVQFHDFDINIEEDYNIEELANIIFHNEIGKKETISQKLYKYYSLASNYKSWQGNEVLKKKLQEICVNRRIIKTSKVPKKDMLVDIIYYILGSSLKFVKNDEELKEELENYYYKRIGQHYRIVGKERFFEMMVKYTGLNKKYYNILNGKQDTEINYESEEYKEDIATERRSKKYY